MADALGEAGMIVTGGYDADFVDDADAFLRRAADLIFEAGRVSAEHGRLPVPALVALRRGADDPEIGYFPIQGLDERGIVAIFRSIADASANPGGMNALPGNLLRGQGMKPAVAVWQAIQLKPSVAGVGIDLKPLIEKVVRKVSGRR